MSGSVTLSGDSTSVAATTAALLFDAGVVPKEARGGVFVVEARNLHCDQYSNMALDHSNPRAALPSIKCRINSENKRRAQSGQAFGEGRAMAELLHKAKVEGGVDFSDCAIGGYCGVFAKSIKCTIDTKNDDIGGGRRWSCMFDNGRDD